MRYRLTEIEGFDLDHDVVLFKIGRPESGSDSTVEPFPYLVLGSSKDLEVGEKVMSISSPEGLGSTVTDGILSAVRNGGRLLQVTAPRSLRNSGGPLLDGRGNVIGVTVSQLGEGQNLNFAVPIDIVKSIKEKPFSPMSSEEFFSLISRARRPPGTAVAGNGGRDGELVGIIRPVKCIISRLTSLQILLCF